MYMKNYIVFGVLAALSVSSVLQGLFIWRLDHRVSAQISSISDAVANPITVPNFPQAVVDVVNYALQQAHQQQVPTPTK